MMMFSRSIRAAAALSAGFWCVSAYFTEARALNCTFSITNTAFGSVDVTANTVFDTTATLQVNCTAISGANGARVCVSLGAGSGGATNAANRFMLSGANTLRYSFFTDVGRSSIWGSYVWAGAGASGVQIDFVGGGGGSQTATRTIYGRIFSGQQTAVAGTYSSAFSGTDAQINYGTPAQVGSCTIISTTKTTTFNATATVPTTCSVAAIDLDFGTAGTLTTNGDASTTVSPTCTKGTAYNIGLNGGLSGATDPIRRKMIKAAEFVLYGLYRDSSRSLPFGNIIGTNTVTGTGSGLAQSVAVFGRIPPQATPSPGTYNDTIVVTLTY
jgi:spore coat protein U-like protein